MLELVAGMQPVLPRGEPEDAKMPAGKQHEEGEQHQHDHLAHRPEQRRAFPPQQVMRELVHGEGGRAKEPRGRGDGERARGVRLHHRSCKEAATWCMR